MRVCSVEGCERKHRSSSYCGMHYQRYRNHGDPLKVLPPRTLSHNMAYSPEYRSWQAMKNRCQNPKSVQWKDYGGRGIKYCERWADFANFYADMGLRPSLDYTLDRINNDGNYEPGNCRWANRTTQVLNQRFRKNNTSGYRGISFLDGYWRAQISVNYKKYHSKGFASREEAALAYNELALKYHGKEARLNIIDTIAKIS